MRSNHFSILSLMILSFLVFGSSLAYGQLLPERRIIRNGNRQFERGNYSDADVSYRRALEKNPGSYEANFNLSDALYKQEQYEDAAKNFEQLAGASPTAESAAEAYFNQGNAMFKQKKYQEAIDAYKNSLRANPNDQEAKFNLAYAKKFLEKDKNDQNKDNKEDKDNKDNKDQKDQNNDNQDQNKDNKDQQKDQKDQQQQPQSGMSKEEAEQMLNAIQKNEDNTREKVEAQKVGVAAKSGKNW